MEEKRSSNLAPALAAAALLALTSQPALAKTITVDEYGRVTSSAGVLPEFGVVGSDVGSFDDNACCNNVNCQCGSNKSDC